MTDTEIVNTLLKIYNCGGNTFVIWTREVETSKDRDSLVQTCKEYIDEVENHGCHGMIED